MSIDLQMTLLYLAIVLLAAVLATVRLVVFPTRYAPPANTEGARLARFLEY